MHAGVRDPASAAELTALGQQHESRLRVTVCDVADEASVRAFAAGVRGPVHLLVNNAGMRHRPDGLEDLDPRTVLRTFQVNALGPCCSPSPNKGGIPRLRTALMSPRLES